MPLEAERGRAFKRRALLLGAGQVAVFAGLASRLYDLQIHRGAAYALLAEDNRANQRLLVPPRGRIRDRLGRHLAHNVPVYRLRIVPEQIVDLPRFLERLGGVVRLPTERIAAALAEVERGAGATPITLRQDLAWSEVAAVALRAPELPGLLVDTELLRAYPQGELFAHILGHLGPVTGADQEADADPLLRLPDFRIGRSGVERAYDGRLRGSAGLLRVEVNALGREVREIDRREGAPGGELRLSVDLDLQRFCMARLSSEAAASAVVLDVATGGVLAMASVPSFDPSAFESGLKPAAWDALRRDPRSPLVNKCIHGQYPPGSTFKMITALAALEAGVDAKARVQCTGHLNLADARFHCWREHGHGRIGMIAALEQSCDVYFYETARRLGIDAIAAMARRFGLGEPVGIDLPGEQPGIVPTRAWKRAARGEGWHQGETLVCGIGQGYVLATPLQLAVMTARLANGGKAVVPWLGEPTNASPAAEVGVAAEALAIVLRGMRDVVHGGRGTARAADPRIAGVEIGGKTGTSQVRRISRAEREAGAYKRKELAWRERDHALFVCFGPFAAPRFAVAAIVEHGVSGARVAAPIGRDILRKALELDPAATRAVASARPA